MRLSCGKQEAASALRRALAVKQLDAPSPSPRHVASTAIQQAVFVKGQVNEVSASLLVDTRSTVTLVHKRLLEGSQDAGGELLESSGGSVVTANGQPLRILGVIRSSFSVAGTEFRHDALVTEEVSQDCLLGADFLLSHGFVVDLKDKMLHKESLSTLLIQLSSQAFRVCLRRLSSQQYCCESCGGKTVLGRSQELFFCSYGCSKGY